MKLPPRHWDNRPAFLTPLSVPHYSLCHHWFYSNPQQKHINTSPEAHYLHIWQVKHQNFLMVTAGNSSTNIRTFSYSCLFREKKNLKLFQSHIEKSPFKMFFNYKIWSRNSCTIGCLPTNNSYIWLINMLWFQFSFKSPFT